MELKANNKGTKLTITKNGATIVLKKKEILVLVVACIDWFGWGWLKDKLEDYLIYVNA
jgi:hypothetical protein